MIVKSRNINGVMMSEVETEVGSVNISNSHSKNTVERVTPGLAIKYVEYGRESYLVKDKEVSISSGQFFLLRDDTHFVAANNGRTKGCCVNLDLDHIVKIDEILDNELLFGIPFAAIHTSDLGKNMQDFANQVNFNVENIGLKTPNLSGMVHSFGEQIVQLDGRLTSIYKKSSTKISIVSSLLKAREFIHLNFHQKITLNQLVKISCLSKYHLLRLFSRCFGVTPIQMQQDLRMEAAAKMLLNQTTSLKEIAFSLGYCDLASFSNSFKSKYHISPSKYKRL